MMIIENRDTGILHRKCDCEGCTNKVVVTKWPSGSYDSRGYLAACGPVETAPIRGKRNKFARYRTEYDVCPDCVAAGKLPPKAENPQPWPMRSA
jgi:hypothetical protein